ncbi:MAG: hypothetical protein IKU55_03655 [Clostridia bacterium]|nr:hypothetical protein [Clostridia bacterium]
MEHNFTEAAQRSLLSSAVPGDVLAGTVAKVRREGVAVTVGSARLWLPRERIALSPICGSERFECGERVTCAVWKIEHETHRILLTHRELLGTFDELAAPIQVGGEYDALVAATDCVELMPNLLLQVSAADFSIGTGVRVRVTEIDRLGGVLRGEILAPTTVQRRPFTYYITNGRIKHWSFHAPTKFFCTAETVFTR